MKKFFLVLAITLVLVIGLSLKFNNKKALPVFLKKEVIGFLPYWLLDRADTDYSQYISNLTYFSLSLNDDGTIQKYTNPGESEPGYYALVSGKAAKFLTAAKSKELTLSLAIFSNDDETITTMLNQPKKSAQNLVKDISPVMKRYGFSELNLDIEQVREASPEAKLKFVSFVKAFRKNLNPELIKSLSIDITGSSLIKKTDLVDPVLVAPYVDKIIIMAYDYHYSGSYVTGAVAPGTGAGVFAEFDTVTVIEKALAKLPAEKIILGIPNYGYEWETISSKPRSATIPGTAMVISNERAEKLLIDNTSLKPVFDQMNQETYVIYSDEDTGIYHQLFYPDEAATQYKTDLAKQYGLAGLAVWALGYEGETILAPLAEYRN